MKIFRFVKTIFFIGLTILSNFINASSSLNCISIKNQKCKTGPQIVNITVIILYFILLLLKLVNVVAIVIILMIHMRKFVSNVKVFNLMSRTNETKFIEWHETTLE